MHSPAASPSPRPSIARAGAEAEEAATAAAEEEEEERAFQRVLHSFHAYRPHETSELQRRRTALLHALGPEHRTLLGWWGDAAGTSPPPPGSVAARWNALFPCFRANGDLLEAMARDAGDIGGAGDGGHHRGGFRGPQDAPRPTYEDMDKVRTLLRQCARDWSVAGKAERDATYAPILAGLEAHFGSHPDKAALCVLVPGAGLARLAFDIVCAGYSTQGNEFSFVMLIASNFLLNQVRRVDQFTIYPWVSTHSNHPSPSSQLQPVTLPDVLPTSIPSGPDFSMVGGDFLQVYGEDPAQAGKWDAVVTCFFLDTARNILAYLDIIRTILAPGGVWINHGPLLYHFEGSSSPSADAGPTSVELCQSELRDLIVGPYGFELVREATLPTTYTGNGASMLQYVYRSWYFEAVKRAP